MIVTVTARATRAEFRGCAYRQISRVLPAAEATTTTATTTAAKQPMTTKKKPVRTIMTRREMTT